MKRDGFGQVQIGQLNWYPQTPKPNNNTSESTAAGLAYSVERLCDTKAGGRVFDSRGPEQYSGLKITEKNEGTVPLSWKGWLGWPNKMAVQSPVRIRPKNSVKL